MTDNTERRLAALLAQISEMIDSRLPQEGIKATPGLQMWQFWIAIGTMIFYSGATWVQIQNNSEAIAAHSEWDKERTEKMEKGIKGNSASMASHFQWELEHELKAKDAEIRKLKASK